jgi:small-conductance mechanosensitive channel
VDTSSRVVDALILAAAWTAVLVVLRGSLWWIYGRYEHRLAEQDRLVAARRRTTFAILVRLTVALAILIGVWSVLKVFPATTEIANAFLASSAVLAVIAGVALTTPLGNLGSGVLLAFTQPVRLGDRITVGDHTGDVKEITLSYTTLVTENGDHVFVPNQTMVSTTLVNRSVGSHPA